MEDLFQARATAESIIENVQEEWVQDACSDLMLDIEELEINQDNNQEEQQGDDQ